MRVDHNQRDGDILRLLPIGLIAAYARPVGGGQTAPGQRFPSFRSLCITTTWYGFQVDIV